MRIFDTTGARGSKRAPFREFRPRRAQGGLASAPNDKRRRVSPLDAAQSGPTVVLLSHRVAPAVPSPMWGLTSVFGMGTGVAPTLWTVGKTFKHSFNQIDFRPRRCLDNQIAFRA